MADVILHDDNSALCACTACSNLLQENDLVTAVDASIDPLAGGTLNGKPIWTADQVAAHLNRTGAAFTSKPTDAKQTDADNSVINYGFFTSQADMADDGYTYVAPNAQGVNTRYGLAEYFNFTPYSAAQQAAVREAMTSWDDVAAVTFRETSADLGDINFGNLTSAPTTQAYSRLPFDRIYVNESVNAQAKWIAGDVWTSLSQASNLRLDEGQYGIHTLVHEVGHSLGLSHPGAYNAAPGVSITYGPNAEYAQDTRAYTVMSYFEGSSISGTRHFDFHTSGNVYAATPLVHDIAAIQRIYGADMTTRTGDTTYGFNSNAGRDSFDFNKTPAPVMAIWDAGGIDTLDASGYATDQVIDLSPGSLSSIGGVTFDTAPTLAQVNANRAANGFGPVPQATYDANMAALKANPVVGRLTNNVGIAYGATIENAVGGSGNDSLLGNSVGNVLTGNAGNDIIGAGAGDDTLDGGLGNDTMLGGIGDDLFVVGEVGDVVTELAGEGTDTVAAAIDYTLGDNVENLRLTGSAVAGTGNALDNVITGNSANNRLSGGAGNDTLAGGAGDDRLDGGVGADLMTGGAGNDAYIVDDAGDKVVELAGEGTDSVSSSIDYVLGEFVENLDLTGAATSGTGNGLDNRLSGTGGTNVLIGGGGNDVFVGEVNDVLTATKRGDLSVDVFLDFDLNGDDRIDLSGIDADLSQAGNQSFNFVGKSSGNNVGDLSYKTFGNINAAENALGFDIDGLDQSDYDGQVTIIFGNNDDDKDADFAFVIYGTPTIDASDFIL